MLRKGKFVLRSLISEGRFFRGGSLLSGFANTCDILSLLSEGGALLSRGRYVRNFKASRKHSKVIMDKFDRLHFLGGLLKKE